MDDDETALLIRDIEPSKELTEATKHNYYHNLALRARARRAIPPGL